jgi:hypothetical protein
MNLDLRPDRRKEDRRQHDKELRALAYEAFTAITDGIDDPYLEHLTQKLGDGIITYLRRKEEQGQR